jgi:hypothetical protein
VNVGDRGREHARRREPLHKPPRDQLLKAVGGRGEQGGNRQQERRGDDHALAADEIRETPDRRCGEGYRDGRRRDGQADREMRGREHAHQQRQQRLSRIEIEEGRESGEDDRKCAGTFHGVSSPASSGRGAAPGRETGASLDRRRDL